MWVTKIDVFQTEGQIVLNIAEKRMIPVGFPDVLRHLLMCANEKRIVWAREVCLPVLREVCLPVCQHARSLETSNRSEASLQDWLPRIRVPFRSKLISSCVLPA